MYRRRDHAVFVKGVPRSWTEKDVVVSLEGFGRVVECKKLHTRGFAFVEFEHRTSAEKARAAGVLYVRTTRDMVTLALEKPETAAERQKRIADVNDRRARKKTVLEYTPLSASTSTREYDPLSASTSTREYDPLSASTSTSTQEYDPMSPGM